MAYKINTAVVGFGIGHFIAVADGSAITTGTPTCGRIIDGVHGACANAAQYTTSAWEIDLAAGDMNGTNIILTFSLTGAIPISYTIKTETKLVSELKDETMVGTNSALLAASVTIADGAIKADLTHIHGSALTETAGQLAAAFVKLFDVGTPLLVASDVMVGTDGANTTTPPTVTQIQTEMEENGLSLLDTIRDELANATDGLSALKTLIDAIPTTMVGTNNAALASVLGAAVGATISADIADIPTVAEFNARSLVSADYTVVSDLGTVQSGDSFARIGVAGTGLSDITVNAASVTAIWAKAMSDLGSIPAFNASVLDAINIAFMGLRNKQTATSSAQTIANNAGATIATAALSDVAGTTTKEEYA